ncbi:hypothetical protein Tco_0609283 [Tanacetum coccineum]
MGIMPTKTELALEQTQQGVSNEVLNIRMILLSIHNDDGNPTSANIKQALRQNSTCLGLKKKYRLNLKNDMPPRDNVLIQKISMAYSDPLNTTYRLSDTESESELIEDDITRTMAEPILIKYMENAQAESNPTKPITDDNINFELNKEFLIASKNNAYHGMFDEDLVDHIAKVLELLYLIKIPGVDSHQLRMKVFPFSLADNARQWWINKGKKKFPLGKS